MANKENDDIDDLLDEVEKTFFPSITEMDITKHTSSCDFNVTNNSKFNNAHSNSTELTHLNENIENEKNRNVQDHSDHSSSDDSDENIDDLIEDICSSSSENLHTPTEVPYVPQPQYLLSPKPKKQCYPVYVGGSAYSHGAATSSNKLTCNKLRCTRCDFKVTIFDNLKWYQDVDYLFLRNNVPDYNRLKSKMLGSKGSCAYCCQCTCRTFRELTELDDPSLKWVCGQHTEINTA